MATDLVSSIEESFVLVETENDADTIISVEEDILIVESEGTTEIIEVGTPGPQGIPGDAAGSYVHDQMSASLTWTVNHNLGRYPTPDVFDSDQEQVEGHVEHISTNQLTITFTSAISGKAYM